MIAGSKNRLLRVVPPPPPSEPPPAPRREPARANALPAALVHVDEFSEHVVTEPGLDALYARYAPYVAAIATRILGRRAEVEDVVQEVFSLAVGGLRRREDHREIKSWLATVTVRRAVQQLRLRAFWSVFDLADEAHYETLADPSADSDESELITDVYRALDRLPPRQRVPWALRHIEGQSLEQVAELCDCSLATAKRRISAAHERIKKYLGGRRG
ncbi:MAG TPA: sigma-70 family RNA polymerase sigma factor [Polyangiaceae bacterium]|jgi:RNA polymerase sigma-70 factor (ECF subfamily)